MFLTRKKADKQTEDAVKAALSRVPDLTPQIDALTQQVLALQGELKQRIRSQREATDRAVTDLRQAVNTVSDAMRDYVPPVQELDPDGKLDAMRDWVWQMRDWVDNSTERQEKKLREMDDLTKYLLEAPPVVREVVTEAKPEVGVRAMYEQHTVRPMGVR